MVALLALLLWVLDWRVIQPNIGTPYNGLGAVPGTQRRSNEAPMRYRVLVPWLLRPLSGERVRKTGYLAIKFGLLWLALAASERIIGAAGLPWLALLIALTMQYDYWSGYAELASVALIVSGDPLLILLGGMVWGLSRETVLLAPVLAGLTGGAIGLGAALPGVLAWVLVQRWQGRAALYTTRNHWPRNRAAVLKQWRHFDLDPFVGLFWTLAVLAAVLGGDLPPALSATRWIAPAWLLAGWQWGLIREPRIFLPTALWIAGALA